MSAQHGPSDRDDSESARLNGECGSGFDTAALRQALQAQGEAWYRLVRERCPHLFAASPVFISSARLQQMREIIAAAEAVAEPAASDEALGVFYGYDFHLDAQGAHLIEINTNAGGGFLSALLAESQRGAALAGTGVGKPGLEQVFLDMFLNEWRRVRGNVPLDTIAIVDVQPEAQYLYPEFLLAQRMFARAGMTAFILEPADLEGRSDGLYHKGRRVDLIYNRLTDFTLQHHPVLLYAWQRQQVVITPNPHHYARHADKRRLVLLSDAAALRARGVSATHIGTLIRGVPETRLMRPEDAAKWWEMRRQWFFKPVQGFGSRGGYRGDKMTRRVFEEVMRSDYVAQRLIPPGERRVCPEGQDAEWLKYDVRCYVYAGQVQLVSARLYQGQTTNFRTPGGGFAVVRRVG